MSIDILVQDAII